MPVAAYRQAIGIAKDTIDTYLTSAVIATATSLPVNGTAVPASSTVFIMDGALSESRAVTAGGGTSTLTVAALTNAHPANTPIYAQLSAGLGPADWIPVTGQPKFSDDYATIPDMGLRGSNVSQYGSTQGAGVGNFEFGGDLLPDVFGYPLGGIFGAVDFSGGTPNTHTFAGMNTAASQGQPTPFLLYYFNGKNTRVFPGAKLSELQLKYDPKGNIVWTAKGLSLPSAVVADATPSYSALVPQAAWRPTLTLGGTIQSRLLTFDLTLKRSTLVDMQTIDGTPSPVGIWAGALEASGSMDFIYEDDTILTNYLANSQPAVSLAFTTGTGASQVGLTVQMTKCNFDSGWAPSAADGYIVMGGPFHGLANTTDANTAGGGYSPAKAVLLNAKATGTYQ